MLNALPPADPETGAGCHLSHKGVHQRGLANSHLAGDEHHLPLPLACGCIPLVQLRQLGVAPHQHVRRTNDC
jgi:hypothetical protein